MQLCSQLRVHNRSHCGSINIAMKRVPTDAHDSNLAKRRKDGSVKPRTKASVIPTGDRVLLADMGHSCITQLIGKLEILLFEEIMEQTTEQQVAIVLLTGLPRGQTNTQTTWSDSCPSLHSKRKPRMAAPCSQRGTKTSGQKYRWKHLS